MAKYGHNNPPPGYAACTREKGHRGPCALPLRGWEGSERVAFYAGMRGVIDLVSQWDEQLASAVNGLKFSDILSCKLNLTRRKRPRKIR